MQNPVGELLIRVKNAYLARHESVKMPYSSFVEGMAKLLVENGFVDKVEAEDKKILEISLKYKKRRPVLTEVKQISKPGRRRYCGTNELAKFRQNGRSLVILSTSRGLMSLKEAKEKKIGGELLCEVW